jgi:hypothetical protein
LADVRLTLIVFKDYNYFTSVTVAVVIVVGLLLGIYSILLFVGVLIYLYVKREYPLESLWPDPQARSRYVHITVANIFLVAAFFWRYGSYPVTTSLYAVAALVLAAPLCALLERSFHRGLFFADWLVLLVLLGLSGRTLVIAHPLLYAVIMFHPRGWQVVDRLCRRLKLSLVYTLMTASVLVLLVVAPSCGFFNVAYNFVQRLLVQREQLGLAEKLRQRQDGIEDYYIRHPKSAETDAERFVAKRRDLDWDRYDRVSLNIQPQGQLQEERRLEPGWPERRVAELTGWFPSNALGAELRELARAAAPPGREWCLRRYASDKEGDLRFLLLADPPYTVTSPLKDWPALYWRVRIPVAITIVVLLFWIHFVHGRIFLCELISIPPLPKWRPEKTDPHSLRQSLLIIAHPKSGKRTAVQRMDGVHIIDLAQLPTTGDWKIGKPLAKVVALAHFEFDIDNPNTNQKKLDLLEDLIYVQHKRIILLSTIDPMFYLSAGIPDILVASDKEKSLGSAMQILDRWAAVLAHFRKLTIEDITRVGFRKTAAYVSSHTDSELREFVHRVVKECNHTAELRIMGGAILMARAPQLFRPDVAEGSFQEIVDAVRGHRSDESFQKYLNWVTGECVPRRLRRIPPAARRSARRRSELSQEALTEELLDRGDAYYHVLWSTCTQHERLVLYQLAKDGWANPNNDREILQLQRRGLVSRTPGLRLMNDSFRHFIRDSQYSEEIASWQQEGEQSLWRSLKLSLGILGVAVAAWLLYSQQQFFNAIVAYVGAIGGALGLIFKLFSELRGGKASGGQ